MFASASVYVTQVNPVLIGGNCVDGDQDFISGNEIIFIFLCWKDIKFLYAVGIAFASVVISLFYLLSGCIPGVALNCEIRD